MPLRPSVRTIRSPEPTCENAYQGETACLQYVWLCVRSSVCYRSACRTSQPVVDVLCSDLLRRHSTRHADPLSQQAQESTRPRAAKACSSCSAVKLRCDDQRPCQRCQRRGLLCRESSGTPRRQGFQSRSVTSSTTQNDGNYFVDNRVADGQIVQHGVPPLAGNYISASSHLEERPASQDVTMNDANLYDTAVNDAYADFLRDLVFAPREQTSLERPSRIASPARFDLWDLNFDWDQHNGLADISFDQIPALAAVDSPPFGIYQPTPINENESPEQAVQAAGGAQAFSKSIWHWLPTMADNERAHQADLALSTDDAYSIQDWLRLSPAVAAKRLSPSDRDRVLSLLLARCAPAHVVRVASAFPSYLLMEKLVQVALHFHGQMGTQPWLHIPTFSVADISDELLSALVAYGSFLSPISALQNLAVAMTDIMFTTVPEQWGRDNATTRHLQQWQCWALIVHSMFWSGSKRKTEIGESFCQPLLTMLRRSGALSRNHYSAITPLPGDSAAEVEAKWLAWIHQESKIRLAHHLFM